jgi:2-(1,2-epoxy-1,2-dihydrophenyl)acetyl-CoA isomerase
LSGDLVVASAKAKFRLAYTAAGLSPDCGASWLLPRRIGLARAMDLSLTNRLVTAAEAAQWGLISRLVDHDDLNGEVAAIAHGLSQGSRQALAETKRLMWAGTADLYAAQLDDEAATISRLAASPDGIEGVSAFLQKRKPDFE